MGGNFHPICHFLCLTLRSEAYCLKLLESGACYSLMSFWQFMSGCVMSLFGAEVELGLRLWEFLLTARSISGSHWHCPPYPPTLSTCGWPHKPLTAHLASDHPCQARARPDLSNWRYGVPANVKQWATQPISEIPFPLSFSGFFFPKRTKNDVFVLNKDKNGPTRPYNRPKRAKNVWKKTKKNFWT